MPLIQGQEVRRINLNGVTRFSPLPSLQTYSRAALHRVKESHVNHSLLEAVARWSRDAHWLFFLNATVLKLRKNYREPRLNFPSVWHCRATVCFGLDGTFKYHLFQPPGQQVKGQNCSCPLARVSSVSQDCQLICQTHRGGKEGHGGYFC